MSHSNTSDDNKTNATQAGAVRWLLVEGHFFPPPFLCPLRPSLPSHFYSSTNFRLPSYDKRKDKLSSEIGDISPMCGLRMNMCYWVFLSIIFSFLRTYCIYKFALTRTHTHILTYIHVRTLCMCTWVCMYMYKTMYFSYLYNDGGKRSTILCSMYNDNWITSLLCPFVSHLLCQYVCTCTFFPYCLSSPSLFSFSSLPLSF